jgi:aspartyl-tRNA(Asn)/glutamyl-tRNA(Gln) amidotransferase subunit A
MTALERLGLVELADLIRTGAVTSVAATAAVLARAAAVQPRVHCFLEIDHDGAMEAAEQADRVRASGAALGPLHGVPLAHKDMFDVAGQAGRCGSVR